MINVLERMFMKNETKDNHSKVVVGDIFRKIEKRTYDSDVLWETVQDRLIGEPISPVTIYIISKNESKIENIRDMLYVFESRHLNARRKPLPVRGYWKDGKEPKHLMGVVEREISRLCKIRGFSR